MNTRAVVPQVALAAVGLVAAFLVWQREPEALPGGVTVLDVSRRSLQRARYEDAARFVELYRDERDEETIWVRLGSAANGAGGETPPRELRGNEAARSLFASLAPLEGMRALGAVDAKKLEELGITGSPRKLALTVGSQQQVLKLASPVGTDWGSPYVLREDGRVFLLGPTLLPDLEGAATRLVDRQLHTLGPEEFDAFTVTQGKNARAFVVSGKQPGPVTVSPRSAPDAPDERVRNWHEVVWQLQPLDVLGRGEEPPGGEPEELFQVEYARGDKVAGFIIVARGAEGDFYARTEHTVGWVRLQGGVDTLAAGAIQVASGSP
ncbi:hypothetical protein [Archangium sp.]|uniref:hypothetical protein n=1 Tax=Archangium sp. TaxID=1872627 RepID=UPI00389AB3E2